MAYHPAMNLSIAVLPGDYIGPEVMAVALPVLEAVLGRSGHTLAVTTCDVGGAGIDRHGTALPEATLAACRAADAILFGSVGGPKWEHLPPPEQPERAALLPLRKQFRLFANVRPGRLLRDLVATSPLRPERISDGVDMICIRELTGGLYFGAKSTREIEGGDVEAIDTMVYRRSEIERITDVAIATARGRRRHVTLVDKANVLETSVLWRKVVGERIKAVAPDVTLATLYIDNAAMQLVLRPGQFDVVLTENMFGDILSDEMAVVCGSLGMMASASLGIDANRHGLPYGLYEPSGGTAPDIAGQDKANPCAQVLSAALMLRHSFGLEAEARAIEAAVERTVADGIRTADIAGGGPAVGTRAMGAAIAARL
jgi:3-isopropylmalate dehydrogenase